MADIEAAFGVQRRVRGPWRRYLDCLAPFRSELHRYCCKLTGNVWDGEDLVQDTLIRVFSMLGKIDTQLDNPKGYLIRTATNLWIDRVRRSAREQELLQLAAQEEGSEDAAAIELDAHTAARELLQRLPPQERAAVVLKDVLDYSLDEAAAVLKTSVGAVKSALHRGRVRVATGASASRTPPPSRALVAAFLHALAGKDLARLEQLCAREVSVEMVGGAQAETFEQSRRFFQHAHTVLPLLGFGLAPRWELIEFEDEPMVLGYRTLNDVEGINEIHRIEEHEGVITRVRLYCFCPDVLQAVAELRGMSVVVRPIAYRTPSLPDVPRLLLGGLWRKLRPRRESRNTPATI